MPEPVPPVFLATAVESVIRAGEIQMAHFGSAMRVDKKGVIDLVTEIDLQVEREFRSLIAGRFPDHVVLGEEFSEAAERDAVTVWRAILEVAEEMNAAVVVVGARGRSGLGSALLGSVSYGVAHNGKRPVLIVPAPT